MEDCPSMCKQHKRYSVLPCPVLPCRMLSTPLSTLIWLVFPLLCLPYPVLPSPDLCYAALHLIVCWVVPLLHYALKKA